MSQPFVFLTEADVNLIDARLSLAEQNVKYLNERNIMLADSMQGMATEVAEAKGAMASASVLIQGFSARLAVVEAELAGVGAHSAALDTLRADLDVSEQELAAAVANNPLPPTEPAPPPAA